VRRCLVDARSQPRDRRAGDVYIISRRLERVAASKALWCGLPALRALAAENGVFLKFSAATAAALPTVDVGLVSLAGARIEGIQGILNGTSNYILTRMGEGLDYVEALREAQDKGIAEPDPASDVGGWDSAAKILLITNTCLGSAYVLKDVHVRGITGISVDFVQSARREGRAVKLLATAAPGRQGARWSLDVRPSLVEASHPLVHVNGTEKGITFLTDSMGSVTLTGSRSSPARRRLLKTSSTSTASRRDIFGRPSDAQRVARSCASEEFLKKSRTRTEGHVGQTRCCSSVFDKLMGVGPRFLRGTRVERGWKVFKWGFESALSPRVRQGALIWTAKTSS
jgi:homoserine dehydrogenase